MMTLVISLFKAKESLLSNGIVIVIVVYVRDVTFINLFKLCFFIRIAKLCFMKLNFCVAG